MAEPSLESLRRIVRDVHRRSGWRVTSWIGAFPMEAVRTREGALPHGQVVDEAVALVHERCKRARNKR